MKNLILIIISFCFCGQVLAESHVNIERDSSDLVTKITSTLPDSTGACLAGGYNRSVYLSFFFTSEFIVNLGLDSPNLTTENNSPSDFTFLLTGTRFGSQVSVRFSMKDDCGLLKINWIELIEGAQIFEIMIGDVKNINMELGRP